MTKNLKYGLFVLMAVWGLSQAAFAARKIDYAIYIPRSSQYEVSPGDWVEVGVTSGYQGSRDKVVVAKKARVEKVSETGQTTAMLNVAMSKKEVQSMRQAMLGLQPAVYVKVVQRQVKKAAAKTADPDGIPELDFDTEASVVSIPLGPETTH